MLFVQVWYRCVHWCDTTVVLIQFRKYAHGNELYRVRKFVSAYLFLLPFSYCQGKLGGAWKTFPSALNGEEQWEEELEKRYTGKKKKKKRLCLILGKPSRRGRTTNSMHAHYMSSSTEIFSKRRKIYSLWRKTRVISALSVLAYICGQCTFHLWVSTN